MTIIVLGGTGFLGQSLIKKLNEKHLSYKLLIHKKEINDNHSFYGDITNTNFLENYISDGDMIVNLVGQENEYMFKQNIIGSYNLLNSAIKKKNIKIIFASSLLVYGESTKQLSDEMDLPKPVSNYGVVKLLSENLYNIYSKSFGLDVTILRFSNIYGPKSKSGIIVKCIQSIEQQDPINIYENGDQVRDFLHVDDASEAILSVLTSSYQSGFKIFNISSGIGIKINKIIDLIEKYTAQIIPKKFSNKIPNIKYIVGDNTKASKFLNFSTTVDLPDGIKDIIDKSS